MVNRPEGLKVQAAHAIARHTELRQQLQAIINTNLNDETSTVEVDVEVLRSLIGRLNESAALIQKQDKKIDDLNNQLFNS